MTSRTPCASPTGAFIDLPERAWQYLHDVVAAARAAMRRPQRRRRRRRRRPRPSARARARRLEQLSGLRKSPFFQ